jgi:hypothetical protein
MSGMSLLDFVMRALREYDDSIEDIVHIQLEDNYMSNCDFESPIETDDIDVLCDFSGSPREWKETYPDCTIWTTERVYTKEEYDGSEYFVVVRRDPNGGDSQ